MGGTLWVGGRKGCGVTHSGGNFCFGGWIDLGWLAARGSSIEFKRFVKRAGVYVELSGNYLLRVGSVKGCALLQSKERMRLAP